MSDRLRVLKTIAGSVLACLALTPVGALGQACRGVHSPQLAATIATYGFGETGAMLVRGSDWWGDKQRSSFHFVSGGSPSKDQDALLHGMIGYQGSRLAAAAYRWSCVSPGAAAWMGAFTGFALELPKEIGDGLHDGFSVNDMGAALVGATLPAFHETVPATRAITFKFFYWPSNEYRNRPAGGFPQLENDYAGQRYYVTLNPGRASDGWPRWLGFAVGHSVDRWATGPSTRQWFITLDYDLAPLSGGSGFLSRLTSLLDQVHFPAPGVRVSAGKVDFGLF